MSAFDCCSLVQDESGKCTMLTTTDCYFQIEGETGCDFGEDGTIGCIIPGFHYFSNSSEACPASETRWSFAIRTSSMAQTLTVPPQPQPMMTRTLRLRSPLLLSALRPNQHLPRRLWNSLDRISFRSYRRWSSLLPPFCLPSDIFV